MKLKGAILVLSGPSGAGKSSLYKKLAQEFPNHYFSISSTTRQKREGEIHGVHYNFISKDEFEAGINNGEFLEWARVHNNYYGTSKAQVIQALEEDKLVVFDIDVQGQINLKKAFPRHTTSVFVTTPNKSILQERLGGRGSDGDSVIQTRLKNALDEVKSLPNYDYLIINESLDEATSKLLCIARSAFCKASLYELESFLQNWEK
ncbi:guanylate kinase [Helicobacter winghamensis]|uniref:Guanylate kinase n=1 Tax=Helicobacter winghamensis TaxID=157268 RepID=A0A2N3PLJ9_9HELI|nr:guanylate kinase [Helicobacter winghamensis]PKT75235.1 guanylate kinase [Helicobacter winghamensis]PKT82731.1 guanylate kinase [Helicobacter winghamensis]PKT82866.1 guanylate kinase [Helicobacter winghamensis]